MRQRIKTFVILAVMGLFMTMPASAINVVVDESIGGTLSFYSDATCQTSISSFTAGNTVYIKATPDDTHTVTGMTANDFTITTSSGTGAAEAPRRTSSIDFGPAVTPTETETPGIFALTLPNANLTISVTFPERKLLTITADSDTKVYDGQPLTKNSFTSTALTAGDRIESVTITGSQTDTGSSKNEPSAARIVDGKGRDVTGSYEITYENGTLTVTPKAITIKAEDQTKIYDNDASTDPQLTATVTGAVEDDKINYSLSREEGQTVGDYAITVTPGSNPNYTVSVEEGTFTIIPCTKALIITSSTKSWEYDAQTHKEDVYTVTFEGNEIPADDTGKMFTLSTGDVVTITSTAEGVKNVGDNARNTFTYALTNADQYDNTVARSGMLSIRKRNVTITGVTAKDRVYTGDRNATLVLTNAVINGKIDGEDLTFTATGLFNTKDVGEKKTVSIVNVTLLGNDKDNYKLSMNSQRSTVASVTRRPLVVTANEKTVSYGDDAANDGVSYDGFADEEDQSVLTGALCYTYNSAEDGSGTEYDTDSPVGIYYIIPSGLYGENYSITYAAGIMTVEAKDIDYENGTVTLDENGYTVILDEGTGSSNPLPDDADLANLTYSRTLKAPGTGEGDKVIDGKAANLVTVCLPFDPITGESVKYYTLSSVSGPVLNFDEVASPVANTPYLVAVFGSVNFTESCTNVSVSSMVIKSTTVDGYTFTGTFTGMSHDNAVGKYILQPGNKWRQVPSSGSVKIPPFRAYIEGTSGASLLTGNIGDEATGINTIQLTDADGTEHWYDLNGRRIEQPNNKGVYIYKGKKVKK